MQKPTADLLIDNAIEVITCVPTENDPLGRIQNGAVAVADGRILATGSRVDLQERFDFSEAECIDAFGLA